jgi:hypothetical protein
MNNTMASGFSYSQLFPFLKWIKGYSAAVFLLENMKPNGGKKGEIKE